MTDKQLYPIWVVIPAAGLGQRMQSDLPKQYLKINEKTLIEHTLDCFLEHDQIAGIVIVLSSDDRYWSSLNINSELKPLSIVEGGSNRSDSVLQGLKYLDQVKGIPGNSWVMVHDAARPCLSRIDLDALLMIRGADCVGGLLASPARDTMKRTTVSENISIGDDAEEFKTVSHTEPRENLWHALTPQIFRLGALQKALNDCQNEGFDITDECSAMEFIGEKPVLVECIHNNIKVTHPSDIALATFLLSKKSKNKEEA